jgi:hypothetical protein
MREHRFEEYRENNLEEDEEAPAAGSATATNPVVAATAMRLVTLSFRPPDWKVTQIARLKAEAELQYFGAPEIVKLTTTVPAAAIRDMAKMQANPQAMREPQSVSLKSERLAALKFELTMRMAMYQGSMTMMMLEGQGSSANLKELQVYDAQGRPWPTMLAREHSYGHNSSYQVVVAGQPPAPLSIAVVLNSGGTTVKVPIQLEKLPITPTPAAPAAK